MRPSTMGARQYTQREWRLLSWWLATFHPHAEIAMQVRVGPPPGFAALLQPSASERKAQRVINRWVDALYVEGGEAFLVEAKMRSDPGVFSQLIHYARLLRADPEFAHLESMPLHLIALVYDSDPNVAVEAPWYGVRWIEYTPALDGLLPPQLRQGPLAALTSPLPPDWPARVSLITGLPLGAL